MLLGIEIGGTKLQLGVGNGDVPELAELVRCNVEPAAGAAGIRTQIAGVVAELRQRHAFERVGFGFGGPVRGAAGRTITSHQIVGWDDFPLADWSRDALGLPAVVGNDCDVAALAESRYGAGRGRHIVLYVTVGTGIGGGLVVDGTIYGTDRPAAIEIGHLRPGFAALSPGATVEELASGRGIEEAARAWLEGASRVRAGATTVFRERNSDDAADLTARCGGNADALTARAVAEAAATGNTAAAAVLRQATDALGWAVAQAVTLLSPEVVVIGGGVSLMGESLFLQPVREAVRQHVFAPLADAFEIVPASLGETVVVHGALALARDGLFSTSRRRR
jgi:glucokinase